MHGLQQLVAFAETVKHGNFAAAARKLGTAPSTLAKAVQRLEASLGVKVFHRTTRRISLTPDGERLYARCQRVLAEIEEMQQEAAGARSDVRGVLRIDMPIAYGRNVLLPILAGLRRSHPQLELDIRLQDGYADLVKDGIDLAVRVGELRDSSLVARRFDEQVLLLCASPAYLEAHGDPKTMDDLEGHVAALFRMPSSGRDRSWEFTWQGRSVTMQPPATVRINDGEAMVQAALLGMGLIQVPDYMVENEIRSGRLREVLPRLRPRPMPISAVYPSQRLLPPRVRIVLDALVAYGLGSAH